MIAVFDILEILAVFLLAVEAIKLENISKFQNKWFVPLYRKINPKLKFVDKLPPDTSFLGRHPFSIFLIIMYLAGLLLTVCLLYACGIWPLRIIMPSSFIWWALGVVGLIIVPLLLSNIVYTAVVCSFVLSIRCLFWIQRNTHNGVVGIMGFSIYLIQFLCRKIPSP